jgi:hypothetical protein
MMLENMSWIQMTNLHDVLPPRLRPPRATPDAMIDPVNLEEKSEQNALELWGRLHTRSS